MLRPYAERLKPVPASVCLDMESGCLHLLAEIDVAPSRVQFVCGARAETRYVTLLPKRRHVTGRCKGCDRERARMNGKWRSMKPRRAVV